DCRFKHNLTSLAFGAASFDHPLDVAAVWSWKAVTLLHFDGNDRAAFQPSLYLGMAIRKAITASPTVVTGRQIHPAIGIGHARDRPTVVNAVGMLIHKHPELDGRGVFDIGHFLIAPPAGIPMGAVRGVVAGVSAAFNKSVHANAADASHRLIGDFAG